MSASSRPLIILPGAGGDHELKAFRADIDAMTGFQTIAFPGWERFVPHDFSAGTLITDLTMQIEERLPNGPIRIAGYSLGGHLGYAIALNLQARGRDIAGFCAIDPSIRNQPLKKLLLLLKTGQVGELIRSARSITRNTVIRSKRVKKSRTPISDSVPHDEARMIWWLQDATRWITSLDRDSIALRAPTVLLRTWPTSGDDTAWQLRCPNIRIHRLPGVHTTLFEPRYAVQLRDTFIAATREWQ